ncbi:MAG: AAA family ATPase [Clostridia bacterium]|nr:AAA family ATPase [Clostridia bacterium]
MKYFNSVSIPCYKGIRQLNIDKFSSVNIITGPNGSGKTTLLHSLDILSNPADFSHYTSVSGQDLISFSNSFDKREPNPRTKISGTILNQTYTVEISSPLPLTKDAFLGTHSFTYPKNGEQKQVTTSTRYCYDESPAPVKNPLLRFRSVSANSRPPCLKKIKEDEAISRKVISFLSLYDEEIVGFHTDDFQEFYICHQTYGALPATFFSDGIQFFLKIAEAFSNFSDGVLAIDGFESQFAKNTIPEVVNFVYQLAKERQIQLFLTTQSAELIDEWLDLLHFYNELDKLCIIRLRSDKNSTTCQLTEGKRAYELRMERQTDFRDENK